MIAAPRTEPFAHIADLVTTNEDKKFEPAARMAAAIISITKVNGGCLPQDLNEKEFTPEQVTKHWHMAQSLAAVEINLMNGKPAK